MKALHTLTILIAAFVLTHGVVMALDPHAMRADAHDPHEAAAAFVCAEDEAVAQGARLPLEPSGSLVLIVPLACAYLGPHDASAPGPEAPSPNGTRLRAFLQVFLN